MTIREYREEDLPQILHLFYETVHRVNAADYTPAQLDVWAPKDADIEKWRASFAGRCVLAAEEKGKTVGFGDADASGYLDRLYVAADFQGKGAGSALLCALEEYAKSAGVKGMTTYASLTAKPFFEKRGYAAKEKRIVERRGVRLTNFLMTKYF